MTEQEMDKENERRGFEQGRALYLSDKKSYFALLETIPKESFHRKGMEAGKKQAELDIGMLDHAETVDRNYKQAFNNGYVLEKADPAALDHFMKQMPNKGHSAYKGLEAGKKQAQLEKVQEKMLQKLNSKSKSKDKDIDFEV